MLPSILLDTIAPLTLLLMLRAVNRCQYSALSLRIRRNEVHFVKNLTGNKTARQYVHLIQFIMLFKLLDVKCFFDIYRSIRCNIYGWVAFFYWIKIPRSIRICGRWICVAWIKVSFSASIKCKSYVSKYPKSCLETKKGIYLRIKGACVILLRDVLRKLLYIHSESRIPDIRLYIWIA